MSKLVNLIIINGMLLFLTGASFSQTLVNGNFETGSTGWSTWGENAHIKSDSGYYKDSASAVLYWMDSGWVQEFPAQENDVFDVAGEIIYPSSNPLNGRNAIIKIEFWNDVGYISATEIGVLTPSNPANTWHYYSGSATAPTGTTKAKMVLLMWDTAGEHTGNGWAYFDNISFFEQNPAPDPDFNDDYNVDMFDLIELCSNWLTDSVDHDLTQDGQVNLADLTELAKFWQQIPQYSGYDLVWSDEFYGSSINYNNWSHQVMGDGGNQELQYYTSRAGNSWVQDGKLIIQSNKENYQVGSDTYRFTSARLITAGKQSFKYGRIEARIKVPTGTGIWPAFWMMPADNIYGTWAASGEIDIMETSNQTDYIGGALHYGGQWPENDSTGGSYYGIEPTDFSQDFHVYTIEWEPNKFNWYVDGVLYLTRTSWWSAGGPYPAPFDQQFYIILNTAIGGTYTGIYTPQDVTATFPQQMKIDWVRVYQKN